MTNRLTDILATAYKDQSVALAEQATTTVRNLWLRHASAAQTPKDLYDGWIDGAVSAVISARRQQAALARAYYRSTRSAEVPAAIGYIPATLPDIDREVVRSSLFYMAFLEGRPAGEDFNDYPLKEEALRPERMSLIGGSATRHVMNGGRQQIKRALDHDPAVFRGYCRILGEDPCGFCALLGTRHDYGAESFDESDARFEGPGDCKVHDECHCVLRPYFVEPALSDQNSKAEEIWSRVRNLPGDNKAKIRQFEALWDEYKRQRATDARLGAGHAPKGLVA